jgi:predicted nucleotide-binding protein (sugar kinase/HSP70/actin superfamily)
MLRTERKKIEAWITKYALTQGIRKVDAILCSDVSEKMISTVNNGYTEYYHANEWFLTREEAVAQAEVLRTRKIESLKKSIQKMEKLKFTAPE